MSSAVATSAFEAPDPITVATSRSRSVSAPSRCAAALRRSDAWASPKCEISVRVTDGEMMATPDATTRTAQRGSGGDAVHLSHADVHEHDIRLELADRRNRARSVVHLSHNLEV